MAEESVEQAFVSIKVKPGHPTGEYRRSGHVFHVATPEVLPEAEVTPEMAADPWLIIRPVASAEAGTIVLDVPADAELYATIADLTKQLDAANEEIARLKAGAVETEAEAGEYLCTVVGCERSAPGHGYKTEQGRDDHVATKHGS